MKGLIVIDRSAVGTDSFLGEFGMNLSRRARAVAIPSLEIDQPDCRRAAHSSSVGPIDETQLFYLESRGIPPDEARKFIVLGFLEPVVARVPLASAQDRLREMLEEKWAASSMAGPGVEAGSRLNLAGGGRRLGAQGSGRDPPGRPPRPRRGPRRDDEDGLGRRHGPGRRRERRRGVRAYQGICSHEYFELDKGFLTAGSLTCALHLSRFDLATGDALDPPAEMPLAMYEVVVDGDRIAIDIPDGPLPVNE